MESGCRLLSLGRVVLTWVCSRGHMCLEERSWRGVQTCHMGRQSGLDEALDLLVCSWLPGGRRVRDGGRAVFRGVPTGHVQEREDGRVGNRAKCWRKVVVSLAMLAVLGRAGGQLIEADPEECTPETDPECCERSPSGPGLQVDQIQATLAVMLGEGDLPCLPMVTDTLQQCAIDIEKPIACPCSDNCTQAMAGSEMSPVCLERFQFFMCKALRLSREQRRRQPRTCPNCEQYARRLPPWEQFLLKCLPGVEEELCDALSPAAEDIPTDEPEQEAEEADSCAPKISSSDDARVDEFGEIGQVECWPHNSSASCAAMIGVLPPCPCTVSCLSACQSVTVEMAVTYNYLYCINNPQQIRPVTDGLKRIAHFTMACAPHLVPLAYLWNWNCSQVLRQEPLRPPLPTQISPVPVSESGRGPASEFDDRRGKKDRRHKTHHHDRDTSDRVLLIGFLVGATLAVVAAIAITALILASRKVSRDRWRQQEGQQLPPPPQQQQSQRQPHVLPAQQHDGSGGGGGGMFSLDVARMGPLDTLLPDPVALPLMPVGAPPPRLQNPLSRQQDMLNKDGQPRQLISELGLESAALGEAYRGPAAAWQKPDSEQVEEAMGSTARGMPEIELTSRVHGGSRRNMLEKVQAADMWRWRNQHSSTLIARLMPQLPDVDMDVNVATDIKFQGCIGKGAFGTVYLGSWTARDGSVKKVAVKLMSPQLIADVRMRSKILTSFSWELNIMARIQHPHIIRCYGGCARGDIACLLVEYMDGGSLESYIYSQLRSEPALAKEEVLGVANHISCALAYLHPLVVHADIKPGNVLLDSSGICKLADFGMSRVKLQTVLSQPLGGTLPYLAPEALLRLEVTEKCDIFSLGVLLWEAATGTHPWNGLADLGIIHKVCFREDRPPWPSGVDARLQAMISKCWAQEPDRRPAAHELYRRTWLLLAADNPPDEQTGIPYALSSAAADADRGHARGAAPKRKRCR